MWSMGRRRIQPDRSGRTAVTELEEDMHPETSSARTEAQALALASGWTAVVFVGIVTTAVGVAVLVWPGETLTVLSVLFGIQLLLFGLFRLISAFSSGTSSPGLAGFVGILGMIAGVIVIRHPFDTVAVLATILGVMWIVGGAIDVISSIADSSIPDRGVLGISGLLSVLAGIVVVAWPTPSVTVIAWVAGLYLVVFGLLNTVLGTRLRSLAS
jgi:uncharacterized membrane protein HdeD (DUF308 family)